MVGFGSANYNQGTFGKGVMVAHGNVASSSIVNCFGVAEWLATNTEINSTTTISSFGGLSKGGMVNIQSVCTMQGYPNFIWGAFETASATTTLSSFGYVAWDGQQITDATWTTQLID